MTSLTFTKLCCLLILTLSFILYENCYLGTVAKEIFNFFFLKIASSELFVLHLHLLWLIFFTDLTKPSSIQQLNMMKDLSYF
jgi:NADH:ubiquinone oxidoreductase subunit K